MPTLGHISFLAHHPISRTRTNKLCPIKLYYNHVRPSSCATSSILLPSARSSDKIHTRAILWVHGIGRTKSRTSCIIATGGYLEVLSPSTDSGPVEADAIKTPAAKSYCSVDHLIDDKTEFDHALIGYFSTLSAPRVSNNSTSGPMAVKRTPLWNTLVPSSLTSGM